MKEKNSDRPVDSRIAEALAGRARNGQLSCPDAFQAAADLGVTPAEVGAAMDSLKLEIGECQLGLFGYGEKKKIVRPAGHVPAETEKLIRESLSDGRITCAGAWAVARRTGRSRFDIACACEAMGIKVKQCQLGAF